MFSIAYIRDCPTFNANIGILSSAEMDISLCFERDCNIQYGILDQILDRNFSQAGLEYVEYVKITDKYSDRRESTPPRHVYSHSRNSSAGVYFFSTSVQSALENSL